MPATATEATPVRSIPEDARTLPGEVFSSCEIFAADQDRIFSRLWVCVARGVDLPAPGNFITLELASESILLLRGDDGEVRAFYNVCRHRGSRLVLEEGGQLNRILCPYHAWAYGRDGRLNHAPLTDNQPGFVRENLGLVGIRIEEWMGFLFINLNDEAPPFSEQIAGLPDLSRFPLAKLKTVAKIAYDVEANWKVVCENYGECYHCPLAHPQLNRVSDFRNVGWSMRGEFWNGGPMQINEEYSTLSTSGKSDRPLLSPDESDSSFIQYLHLYPNLLLSIAPDYAMTHTLWPLAPGRTRVVCEWMFPEEVASAEGFDAKDVLDFWDLTNRQDWELCARVQHGASSRGYRQGPYHEMELCVYTFDSWYLKYMSGDRG
jgi:Rieske 2Fe-2S family protein